jgi:hypothetical protein
VVPANRARAGKRPAVAARKAAARGSGGGLKAKGKPMKK